MTSKLALATLCCAAVLSFADPAAAIVIGNADSNASDYVALATTPGFSHTDAFGSVSYRSAYSSVGQIYGTTSSGAFAASGVLVASDWVLTAGHVTSGATSLKFWLDGGSTDFGRAGGIAADRMSTIPLWTGNVGGGYDVGLVHLSSAAPCVAAGTCSIAKLNSGSTNEFGKVGVEVGYGKTGTGATVATSFDGAKRAGTNVIDGTYGNGRGNILVSDFDSGARSDNYTGSTARTSMEAIIAPGDSGGGLFVNDVLVGITSFIAGYDGNADSDFGDVAGWTRVSSVYSWIVGVIGGGTTTSTTATAANTRTLRTTDVEVPEPGSLALLGFAAMGLLVVRRRVG